MHDPLTVLFEIRRPWPTRSRMPKRESGFRNRIWGNIVPCPDRRWNPPDNSAHPEDWKQWRKWEWRLYALRTPFWWWARRRWYFPSLFTIWHVDRDECGDDDSCRRGIRRAQTAAHSKWQESKEQYQVRFDRTGKWPRETRQLARIAAILWWMFRKWHWFHPHHWKVQFRPWQSLTRMLDRCETCGKRFKYGSSAVSSSWHNPPRVSRFGSRPGLRHMACDRTMVAATEKTPV